MITEVLSSEFPAAIDCALLVLRSGGLVAFPTDTVYGLAARAADRAGINRLYEAKDRDSSKAIAILIGNLSQLHSVTLSFNFLANRLAECFWPGALTLVVNRHPDLPDNLSPIPTIGVRMPAHDFARDLILQAGPLATTSANQSGNSNPLTAQDVLSQLDGRIELVLDGGATPGGIPSTVVDCTKSEPVVLRQGAISAEAIFLALKSRT